MTDKRDNILIITGGHIDEDFLQKQISRASYSMIIAADRGLLIADRLKLVPDYIVGDFDSVPEKVLDKYRAASAPIKTFPTEKDKTDTQIALELALMHSPGAIDLVGATGSRLDHTLANLHLLLLPLQLGINACILDENNRIYLKNKSFYLTKEAQHGDYVSLLPFTGEVKGLSLTGFKYPLDHVTMVSGSSLGISNELREEAARVEFTEGILAVFETKD